MDNTKPILALIAILAGGLLFVAYSHISPAEGNAQYGMMLDKHKLIHYAQGMCTKAIHTKLNATVYEPSSIRSNDIRFVELTWDTQKDTSRRISCRYEAEKGLTELAIDGKPLGPVSVDISEDSAARAPGTQAGKHWGHW